MWALKNGDLDEVKDYVAKVSGDAPLRGGVVVKPRAHRELGRRGCLDAEGPGSVWPSVPGNRCVAKAAVACVTPPTPPGSRRLGSLFRSLQAGPLPPQLRESLNEAVLHLGLAGS